jgi:hypothetical protein
MMVRDLRNSSSSFPIESFSSFLSLLIVDTRGVPREAGRVIASRPGVKREWWIQQAEAALFVE